ncbi:hypothetical protein [Paractinoplanes atraurantiacus]|uniref:hypothetical protein n=1 Tax=Paractinoplanes atraurantiacus TaxID=1036182 RepID=UPI001FE40BFB|nr:hypothetical protein [Actinoplanes atraurantiacus]
MQDFNWFWVDGESLAEGGVVRELAVMAPALRSYGVDLRLENVNRPMVGDIEGEYVVAINDRICVVWAPEEVRRDLDWETATIRPLAVINDLLEEAGVVPRLFTLYAGVNEGIAWLLDPQIVAAVADSRLFPSSETPALATHRT